MQLRLKQVLTVKGESCLSYYLLVPVFPVFFHCSYCFKKSSIILLEYNAFYIPLVAVERM